MPPSPLTRKMKTQLNILLQKLSRKCNNMTKRADLIKNTVHKNGDTVTNYCQYWHCKCKLVSVSQPNVTSNFLLLTNYYLLLLVLLVIDRLVFFLLLFFQSHIPTFVRSSSGCRFTQHVMNNKDNMYTNITI